jgi:hypothetical protein
MCVTYQSNGMAIGDSDANHVLLDPCPVKRPEQ